MKKNKKALMYFPKPRAMDYYGRYIFKKINVFLDYLRYHNHQADNVIEVNNILYFFGITVSQIKFY